MVSLLHEAYFQSFPNVITTSIPNYWSLIKMIESDNKFVCDYYCFYNFILKEKGLLYIFNIILNAD